MPAPAGRPRDASIDRCVLDATLGELSEKGYAGLSIASVAQAAGTTRPAIYRRWKDKSELVVDAVARLAEADVPTPTGDVRADVQAELENFAHCITEAGALPLAGMMLAGDLDPAVRNAYLERIVAPRRARLRSIFEKGLANGQIDADADLAVALSFLTGSWYSFTIAGTPIPDGWASRVTDLVLAAVQR